MQSDDYSRLEHLKLIQAVIGRMAQNSFTLKGWSVTLVAAFVALAVGSKSTAYAALAFFPAAVFWGLDGYYLWQERRFRDLYDATRDGRHSTYSLATLAPTDPLCAWFATLFRPTVLFLHAAVLAVITAVILSLAKQ